MIKLFFLFLILIPQYALAGSFAGGIFEDATCDVLWYINDSLGALLMSVGILFAAVAMGLANMKPSIAAITAGIGSYSMYSIVTLFFGEFNC